MYRHSGNVCRMCQKHAVKWKGCLLSMFLEICNRYEHVLVTLKKLNNQIPSHLFNNMSVVILGSLKK